MPTVPETKKQEGVSVSRAREKIETKPKATVPSRRKEKKAGQEVHPIPKQKEWKLLYKPYPLNTSGSKTSQMTGTEVTCDSEEKDSAKYKGLCRNCKKSGICSLPKPDGGVWRCEQYE
jgi:hypothetical protein